MTTTTAVAAADEWRNLFLWYQQAKPANLKLINQITHTHTLTKLLLFLFAVAVTRERVHICIYIHNEDEFEIYGLFFSFHLIISFSSLFSWLLAVLHPSFMIIFILCNQYKNIHIDNCIPHTHTQTHTNKMRKIFYDNHSHT